MPTLILKKGREKSLLRRHPWIFSGAVKSLQGKPRLGQTVDVVSADGTWLAAAAYSPQSQIAARVWTFQRDEAVDAAFFGRRARAAVQARAALAPDVPARACRLVHAESDGLPGVVVDRYGDWLCGQFMTAGAELWKAELAARLLEFTGCKGFWERSDGDMRSREGLTPVSGPLLGDEPPELVEIEEPPARFLVDLRGGHKTGFYLDQRDNRRAVGKLCAGRDVLNCFSYTGGFGISALLGGAARCTHVDVSAPALSLARENSSLNGLRDAEAEYLEEDVFQALRRLRGQGRTFDVVVLDPPKFADSRASLQKACRGYKDINLQALKLLAPGGLLFTFSCSGLMNADLFQKVVAGAALDAGGETGQDARIVRRFTQAPDHPVALPFPEGDYLNGLLVQVA